MAKTLLMSTLLVETDQIVQPEKLPERFGSEKYSSFEVRAHGAVTEEFENFLTTLGAAKVSFFIESLFSVCLEKDQSWLIQRFDETTKQRTYFYRQRLVQEAPVPLSVIGWSQLSEKVKEI